VLLNLPEYNPSRRDRDFVTLEHNNKPDKAMQLTAKKCSGIAAGELGR
jgi:hypothetical protein